MTKKKTTMKVTLLSGFLGAGKTTLLKRILRVNNHLPDHKRLKMAVIVNDMGEVNLDADEIKTSRVVQEDAQMVEMHNGCICCTLRGDLLKTVKSLSEENKYDYLVIESTGIGEPLPVAQTFTMDVDGMQPKVVLDDDNQTHHKDHEHHHSNSTEESSAAKSMLQLRVAKDEKQSLSHYAKLDTLVTVVDALNIFDVLGSLDTLASKNNIAGMNGLTGAAPEEVQSKPKEEDGNETESTEDESTDDGGSHGDNKNDDDTVESKNEAEEEEKNNTAEEPPEIDDRTVAQLLLDQIEFANVIVVSKAKQLEEKLKSTRSGSISEIEGLLEKLNPGAKIIVPKQDKYGDLDVSRELIDTGLFNMVEAQTSAGWMQELMGEHTPETEEYGISSTLFKSKNRPFHPERLFTILNGFGSYGMALNGGADEIDDEEERNGAFRGVVRAKGQLWLANANAYPCDFQTAGKNITVLPNEEPFMAAMPRETWDEVEEELYRELKKKDDWNEKYGDRRSLLVFIGIGMDKALIHKKLTEALLTEEESEALGGMSGWNKLRDPFFDGRCKLYDEIQ
jgi:G3E family GTPase